MVSRKQVCGPQTGRGTGKRKEMNMTNTKIQKTLAALLTALMLLVLGGWAPAPAESSTDYVDVKTVDELVAAIGPNTTVVLQPGEYALATAASYGKDTGNPYCRWEAASADGFELRVSGANGLAILGTGMDVTTLLAEDRYANVLSFTGCQDVTVSGLTAGHSPAPGYCSGGVLYFVNCDTVLVESCGLFGCGSMGVWAMNCSNVDITLSRIYECSDIAIYVDGCRNVQVLDCEIDHNGWKNEYPASCLFQAYGGDGFTVSDCRIHDNVADLLLQCGYTRNASFVSDRVEYNTLNKAFVFNELPATVDGCAFYCNDLVTWYGDEYGEMVLYARDATGKELFAEDLDAMKLRNVPQDTITGVPVQEPVQVPAGGEITVTNVDEFLAAIGPDRTIVLDGDSFSLKDAANYGSLSGQYYRWEECYDGPQLVISAISNLTIRGAREDGATTLTATPRYADVIGFSFCDNVTISGLTLGHSEGNSECSGAVLGFENCNDIGLNGCHLYGCGTLGIDAWYCTSLTVTDCEIYDCSIGGVVLGGVYDVTFENCSIYDVPSPAISLYGCNEVMWNNADVFGEHYDVSTSGDLIPVTIG